MTLLWRLRRKLRKCERGSLALVVIFSFVALEFASHHISFKPQMNDWRQSDVIQHPTTNVQYTLPLGNAPTSDHAFTSDLAHVNSSSTLQQMPLQYNNNTSLINIKAKNVPRMDDIFRVNEPLLQPGDVTITGTVRQQQVFLTIGVPSIWRNNVGADYIKRTLRSLVDNITPPDRANVIILVFLADFSASNRDLVKQHIHADYREHLASGLLQLLEVDRRVYPPLEGLKRNYNDVPERVSWRSKQNCDFAFMFDYGSRLSKYYLQIEDDVETVPQFVRTIDGFIKKQKKPWVTLLFSELGFIGKLYEANIVAKLSRFLIFFYTEMPVDYLFTQFAAILTYPKMPLCKPTLFQHFGQHSSLPSKHLNKLKDRFFAGKHKSASPPVPIDIVMDEELVEGDNPRADVYTTIRYYQKYKPELAYRSNMEGFFWGVDPKVGDTYMVVFEKAQRLSSVFIRTGHPVRKTDKLKHGRLEVGSDVTCNSVGASGAPHPQQCQCLHAVSVGQLTEGTFNTTISQTKVTFEVKCLSLVVTEAQNDWIALTNVEVWTYNKVHA